MTVASRVAVMDHGYVQQFDTPREIYANPQTVFVADFIGQCTFIDGSIESIGETLSARIPNNQLVIGRTTIEGYPFESGERVKVAIRPEDLHLNREEASDNEIVGKVTRTIYVGNALEAYFRIGDISAEALLDPDLDVKEGDDIHLFAPQDEVMILPIGGVDALRKVPGHPLALAPAPSRASSNV